jgi:dGTPase
MNWQPLLSTTRTKKKSGQGNQPSPEESFRTRSAFEQDYDRIIFSHPFRRLQDKTQVHPLPEQDFVHTRLTHSLEVSSVGRSLGKRVGEVIIQRHPHLASNFSLFDFGAIVAAASLAHDLGNPPFGHAGEDAISDFFKEHTFGQSFREKVSTAEWEDLIKFEGNAQGFRILSKEEYGLKLTFATLGAFTKYPCPAFFPERDKKKRSQKKFGFFQSEASHFQEVANELELMQDTGKNWSRHPLAFLVEAADDICYSIIDLEDGCRLGLLTFDETVDLLSGILRDKLDRNKLKSSGGLNEKLGTLRAMAIGELIDASTEIFLAHESQILSGNFDQSLTDLCVFKDALRQITDVSIRKIYRARHVVEIEASGHQILPGLLEEFCKTGDHLLAGGSSRKYDNLVLLLPEEVTNSIRKKPENTYHMLRHIVDFVSGLTDKHALSLYRKLKGISL